MKFGFNILIGSLMIPLVSSCVYDVRTEENVSIDWTTVDLPQDSLGQAHPGLAGPLVGKIGDMVLIGGGANFPDGKPWEGGQKHYHKELFLYTWQDRLLTYVTTYHMPFSLAYAACCSDENRVYVVGGENENGLHRGAYILRMGTDRGLQIDTLPSLPEGVSNAALICIDRVLYLIGGDMKESTSDQILRLDIQGEHTWENVQRLPHKISHAVTVAVGNNVYIMGGRSRVEGEISPFSDRVYCFNIEDDIIKELNSLPEPLAAAVGIRNGHHILFLGGDNAQTYHQVEELLLHAATEQDLERKDSIVQRKNTLQVNHPGFSKKQMVYDVDLDTWKTLQVDFPFAMPVTTTAIRLDSNFVMIPSGEIKAGVRTEKVYIGEIITQN